MKCENCGSKHNGIYGSGRFCSNVCARSFSTKEKRQEINEQVSTALSGRKIGTYTLSLEDSIKGSLKAKENRNKYIEDRRINAPFHLLKKKDIPHRLLLEQNNKCANDFCSVGVLWNGQTLTLQIDHIDGNRKNNERQNLRLLCPNCHTQTKTFGSKNSKGESKVRQKEGCRLGGLKSRSKFKYESW